MLAPRVRWMLRERGMSQRDAAILLRDMYRESSAAPTQGNIGRIIDGHRKVDGRGPEVDRKAEKIINTMGLTLNPQPPAEPAGALTADPFQLRITS